MKKIFFVLLSLAICFTLIGCTKKKGSPMSDSKRLESERFIDSIMAVAREMPDEYYYMDEDELRDSLIIAHRYIKELEEKLNNVQIYMEDVRDRVQDAMANMEDGLYEDAEYDLGEAENGINEINSELY